jgi:O-antigen ligase
VLIRESLALGELPHAIDHSDMSRHAMPSIFFWLPVVMIAIAVFDNHARFEYAETAIGMKRDYRNEVEYSTSSSRSKQLTFLGFAAMGTFFLSRNSSRTRDLSHWSVTIPAVLLLVYMLSSSFWSDEPMTTIRRTILASCIVIGAWGLGKAWSLREFCLAVLVLSGTFLVVGVFAEIYFGTFLGIGGEDYRFSGVLHPARECFSCSMMALACFSLYRLEKRTIFLVLASVAIAFALLTKARTGTGALIVATTWFWWRHLSVKQIVAAVWTGLIVASLLFIYLGVSGGEFSIDAIARMGRKDELADPATFTGRLPIWQIALELFSHRPFLGYGYGAFWDAQRIEFFERQTGWNFTHAHSAYVESLVNLGATGVLLGLTVIAATFRRCMKLTSADDVARSFVGSLLIFGLVSGVAESAFVDDGYELIIALIGISYIAFRRLGSEADDV